MLALLWAVPAVALLFYWSARRRRTILARLGDADLVRELSPRASGARRLGRALLLLAALALLLVALAGPQWGEVEEEVHRVGVDVILVVDTSLSMLAEDVRPSRLEKARLELREFLGLVRGDRVGLVVFSSTAHVVVPLTLDAGVLDMFLDVLDTDITSGRGTAVGDALDAAVEAFSEEVGNFKAVVLVTDGEDHGSAPLEAARRAAEANVRVFTVGVGSAHGEPIPMRDQRGRLVGYKEDRSGHVVTSRLDEATLREIASITGGSYHRLSGGEDSLSPVYDEISTMEAREIEERMGRRYRERFQWPLGACLLLLMIRGAVPEGRPVAGAVPRRTR